MTGSKDGEIILIEEAFNDMTAQTFYLVTIKYENKPELKLGKCEVTQ